MGQIKSIADVDKNFEIVTKINKDDVKFYDASSGIFPLYGLVKGVPGEEFRRLPSAFSKTISEHINFHGSNSTGGRMRFITNSKYVALHCEYRLANMGKSSTSTSTSTSGFDLYIVRDGKAVFYKQFSPPYDFTDGFESVVEFPNNEEKEIIIHFPLYNGVKKLYVGLQDSAYIKPSSYKHEKPIVFYGSSITQGGCSSRPGLSYENYISRYFDTNFINLGFSGRAMGEPAIAEYIAGLDMSIFVMDYDHNAPNAEHLEKTHETFFKIIRKAQPDTPIIIMSKTDVPMTESAKTEIEKRKSVIHRTYENAVASGDQKVYFIDGQKIFANSYGADCTVDACHPNDLGFAAMGETIIKVIENNKLI